jgi:Leucine-rich repeat (LRR) protein
MSRQRGSVSQTTRGESELAKRCSQIEVLMELRCPHFVCRLPLGTPHTSPHATYSVAGPFGAAHELTLNMTVCMAHHRSAAGRDPRMVLRRMLLLVGCCLLLTTSIASAAPAVAAPIRASSAASPLGHSLGAAAAAVRALEVDPLLRTPKWSVEPSTLHFQAGSTSGAIRRPRAISWTPARPALTQLSRLVTAAAIEPQLRYTLFAEQKQRSKQLPPHPIKICSRIHDGADSSALSCDLADLLQDEDEDVDDEGQPITFHLLTECVASVGDLHPCDSVFSAGLTVASSSSSFAPSCAARAATASSSAFSRSSVVAPVANISRITNDTEVRDDLARFYNEAGGPSWPAPDGWLQSNVSVCDWAGLGCDGTRTALISMGPISGLITSQPIDLSFLFAHVSTLQTLSFQDDISQLQVSAMDLSAQSNLQNLRVDGTSPGTSQRVVTAITLPNPCLVGTLYWSTVHLQLVQDWEQMSFPAITSLWLQDAIFSASAWAVPIPLLAIMKMSLLTNIYVDAATINASQPDGQGRTGGMLVHHWLENLDASHPQLQSIFFSSAVIPFDRTPNDPNNFPHFNSSTVTTLSLADLLLHTDASGASWTLPSLQRLMIFGCHSVTVPLSLIGASLGLTELNLRDVGVSGELVDLTPLSQLGTVTLESTGLVSRWPVNLSQAWSQLTSWTIIGATLTGAIASFADLSMLTLLQLSDCGLAAELPSNFLSGCAALMDLSISQHPLLVGLLPNLADAAFTLEALVLQENGFEDDLARFLSVPFPFLNRLELNNQRIFGELPQNMWDFLPVVAVVSMQLNALSGPIPAPSTVRFLDVLNLASNMKLNGSFPTNLTANVIDVSSTSLSGPLIFTLHPQPIYALSIAFTQITCPLLLPPSIIHLEMQGAAFSGCDFNNPQDVSLLPQLEYLDISNVQWQPFQFLLPPTLETLVAVNSSITSMVSLNAEPLSLTTLDLSQNPLRVETQVTTLAFISSCSKLLYLTMSNSSLQMEVADLLTLMVSGESPGSMGR